MASRFLVRDILLHLDHSRRSRLLAGFHDCGRHGLVRSNALLQVVEFMPPRSGKRGEVGPKSKIVEAV